MSRQNYYPGGLAWSSSTEATPKDAYKFNDLERVEDFGLNMDMALYRNYDPALLRWNQIDPKLDVNSSPYIGFGNNPIKLIDPLGDTIAVAIDGVNYKYLDGNLYDRNGNKFTPDDGSFGYNILAALNDIANGGDFGKNFINELTSMSEYISITKSRHERNVTLGVRIHAETGEIQSANTDDGFQAIPFDIVLGHELAHAYSNAKGATFSDWTGIETDEGEKTLSSSEIYASHIENILRKEQGHSLRTYYSPYRDGSPVLNTRLTDNKGRSLFFKSGVTDFNATSIRRVKSKLRYVY